MKLPTSSHPDLGRRSAVWVRIEPGRFLMGSSDHSPEEAPARWEQVDGLWIQDAPVTNAMFAEFVACTGYVMQAELALSRSTTPVWHWLNCSVRYWLSLLLRVRCSWMM
ncbi:sulfatase-modifying factor enzyme 1 [Pseudomonas duriflava]|uniref:Sulfatase-modifying factor enzyme 1 n=1 Tax=Pseudomonas duriflava TaxID=459528 RepID=A0A562PUZ5_9PSED|nr:SUMF1/EgtB/PvdO family nonheme iron enzyme [Pseudomonas duriflava]TWI48229.1 sulfatase-modifying factor enzyme 1 [Pseudomonas duriflava]